MVRPLHVIRFGNARRLTFRSGAQRRGSGVPAKSLVGCAFRAKINVVARVKRCSILAASVLYSLSLWRPLPQKSSG